MLEAAWGGLLASGQPLTVETTYAFLTQNRALVEDPRAVASMDLFMQTLRRNKIYPSGEGPPGYELEDPDEYTFERRVEAFCERIASGGAE